jgi:hypothetical protein
MDDHGGWSDMIGKFQPSADNFNQLSDFNKEHLGNIVPLDKFREQVSRDPVAPPTAGKSLAAGCTTLLAAQNNGKSEWFEKADWYQKALRMCSSIARQDPHVLDKNIAAHQKHLMSKIDTLRNKPPKELMRSTCMKINQLPSSHAVRSQQWFSQAQRMCAIVANKSPEQLQSMFQRSSRQAESAGGQLMKRTCANFHKMDQFKNEAWHQNAIAMCSKLGPHSLHVSDIARRCASLQSIPDNDPVKMKPWYNSVATACKWVNNREFGLAQDHQDFGQTQQADSAILV